MLVFMLFVDALIDLGPQTIKMRYLQFNYKYFILMFPHTKK